MVLKEGVSVEHVQSSLIEEAPGGGKVIRVKSGRAHIVGSGFHFVLPGEVHFGFMFKDVKNIDTPGRKNFWKYRGAL